MHRRRRYGRGQSGGQVRDDRRVTYDPARDARRGADAVLFLPSASCYDDGVVDLVSELILIFFTRDATVEVSAAGDSP